LLLGFKKFLQSKENGKVRSKFNFTNFVFYMAENDAFILAAIF